MTSQPDSIVVNPDPADDTSDTLVVRTNQAVAPGAPFYAGSADEARGHRLATTLMEIEGLDGLLLQDQAVTLLKPVDGGPWAPIVEEAVRRIEDYLAKAAARASEGPPEMTDEEKELAIAVQQHLNQEINPMVATHGGFIEVLAVQEDTLFVNMAGGCQGCGQATATLKQGVETSVFRAFPAIREVLDTTDHAAGTNPYYAS